MAGSWRYGSTDDLDGSTIYKATLDFIEQYLEYIRSLIYIIYVGPSD